MQVEGLRRLGSSPLAGRSEGLQVVGTGSRLFIAHLFSGGFTEVDIIDPRRPQVLSFTPAPQGSWSVHLQVQDDLLLAANGPDMWSRPVGFDPGRDRFDRAAGFAAGVRLFDVGRPGHPRQIGFHNIGGAGAHRVWFIGGRFALVSAAPPGFAENVLVVLDVSNPADPVEVDRWWLPGLGPGEAEAVSWPSDYRVSLHHATAEDGSVYAAWRDGGVTTHPWSADGGLGPATHVNWSKSSTRGCAAHSAVRLPGSEVLAVAEEGIESGGEPQDREVVLFGLADPLGPHRLGALPRPLAVPRAGARYGPHNLHEYRPGAWQDGSVVFVAHQGAGLRVYRVSGHGRGSQTGLFLPDPPHRVLDPRPGRALVPQTNDVFVRSDGVLAVVDANVGLDLLEMAGA